MQRNPYIFDNAAEAETAERFASLDALYNFRTFRFLETTGIGPGWHCLEVGGGERLGRGLDGGPCRAIRIRAGHRHRPALHGGLGLSQAGAYGAAPP